MRTTSDTSSKMKSIVRSEISSGRRGKYNPVERQKKVVSRNDDILEI
jgi:hypothetical protein